MEATVYTTDAVDNTDKAKSKVIYAATTTRSFLHSELHTTMRSSLHSKLPSRRIISLMLGKR